MTDSTYRVVFSGSPLPGTDRDTAIRNFATLFKRAPEQVEAMFSGQPSVIKKGISEAEAGKYCRALEKAGVEARAEAEMTAVQPAPPLPPVDDEPGTPSPAPAAADADGTGETRALMTCPACGHEQPQADVCAQCGAVIADDLNAQAEPQRPLGEQGNLWPDAPDSMHHDAEAQPPAPAPSFFSRLLARFKRG